MVAPLLSIPKLASFTLPTGLTYAAGNFATGTFNAFNQYILPSFLSLLRAPPIIINLLSSTSSIQGTVVQPLVGAWSDRGWHDWLGCRRLVHRGIRSFLPSLGRLLAGAPSSGMLPLIAAGIFLFTLAHSCATTHLARCWPTLRHPGSVAAPMACFPCWRQPAMS